MDAVTEVATDGEMHKQVNLHFHTFLTKKDWDGVEHARGDDEQFTKIISNRAASFGMLFPTEPMLAWLAAFAEWALTHPFCIHALHVVRNIKAVLVGIRSVSYTHLTLPTKRIV